MKSNQERQCRDCELTYTYSGEKHCLLDDLPLGKLFWTHGCVPTNFLHTSTFEALDEEIQDKIREILVE